MCRLDATVIVFAVSIIVVIFVMAIVMAIFVVIFVVAELGEVFGAGLGICYSIRI